MNEETRKFLNHAGMFFVAIWMIWFGCTHSIPANLEIFYWQIVSLLLAACGVKAASENPPVQKLDLPTQKPEEPKQ